VYNKDIPIEMFEVVVIDECHGSIYIWRQVHGGSENVTSPRRERGNVENGMKESAGSLS
jgi:hypothetical protein